MAPSPVMFPDKLRLESFDSNKKAEWTLLERFRYCTPDGRIIEAPKGLITDLASVPWGLRAFFKRDSLALRYPCIPHDWLFTYHNLCRLYPGVYGRVPDWLTIDYANRVFRWACEENPHCGSAQTKLFKTAVDIGRQRRWERLDIKRTRQQHAMIKGVK